VKTLVILAAAMTIAPPAWLYPQKLPANDGLAADQQVTVPGAGFSVPASQLHDRGIAVDWFPSDHPPPPDIVVKAAKPGGFACGYCHMVDGIGHPQNVSIAGLPEAYVIAQFAAFRAGQRKAAMADYVPNGSMTRVANDASDADIAATARYYSRLPYRSRIRVIESPTAPKVAAVGLVWERVDGPAEPIAGRIVELMDTPSASILHDPRGTVTAFVPPGSIAAGRRIGATMGCMACHIDQMAGWGPGRSPSYIVRQLLAFHNRTRDDPGAAPMQAVADQLSLDDMVAVAAWLGDGAKPEP
jgi:cytochrome c553